MPEIRAGFPKHLRISSLYQNSQISLNLRSVGPRVRRKLYEIVGAESTSGDF